MPPRVSQRLKTLRGTARPGRTTEPGARVRIVRVPEPPAALSGAAQAEWRALAPMLVASGVLTAGDLRALGLLCETLGSAAWLAGVAEREGTTVAAGSGGVKAHPALAALATTRAQALALLAHFGLTPKSRDGVDSAPAPLKPHPLAEFAQP